MKLLDSIMFYISVPTCVGCGERLLRDERVLCKACREKYDNTLMRNCSRCAKRLCECSCTNDHLDAHYVHRMIKVYRYIVTEDVLPANNLIYCLKRDNRKDVIDFISDELSNAIKASVKNPESYVFTSVPRRRRSIVKYGMDHAEVLAKATAKKLGATYMKTLISRAKSAQKKSKSPLERMQNANFKLIKESLDLEKKNVILIDDIVTTGASMGNCAMLLKSAGAGRIIGAAIAIAYKDSYTAPKMTDRFFPEK